MSKDRRKKVEKRARRKRETRVRLEGLQARVLARTHECPDCGEDYRDDKPTDYHRTGPCGASKEKIEKLQVQISEFEGRWLKALAEDRWIDVDETVLTKWSLPCLSCSRKIIEDEEDLRTCEGELLWVGCDHCRVANDMLVEERVLEIRLSWPEVREKVQEIEKHIEAEAKARFERYVAPFMKPEDLPPGITPQPLPPGPGRSIYDRAMEPVPFPVVRPPEPTKTPEPVAE